MTLPELSYKLSVLSRKMAPQVLVTPRSPAHRTWRFTVDDLKSSAPARTPNDPKTRLAKLEQRYCRELLPEDERLDLRETIVRLRRKPSS